MVTTISEQAKAFKDARIAMGLSLAEASVGICSESYLSLIEAGKRKASVKIVRLLASRLQVSVGAAVNSKAAAIAAQAELAVRTANLAEAKVLLAKDSTDSRSVFVAGLIAEVENNLDEAFLLQSKCLERADATNQTRMDASIALVRIADTKLHFATAIEVGERALRDLPKAHDVDVASVSELRATLAGVYCQTGDMLRALQLTDPANFSADAEDRIKVQDLWSRSYVLASNSQFAEASVLAANALSVLEKLDRPIKLAMVIFNHAYYLLQSGSSDLDAIENEILECLEIAENAKAKSQIHNCRLLLGVIASMRGDEVQALGFIEPVLAEVGLDERARALEQAAGAYLRLGLQQKGHEALLAAREVLETSGANRSAAQTWRQLAAMYEELGDDKSALACMKAASDLVGLHANSLHVLA